MARRVRLDLAYDGTDFAGWQVQPGFRTVQGTLGGVLSRLLGGRPVRPRGAGRTDAGVHAIHQVADARVTTRLGDERLLEGLRALLPSDLRPLRLATTDDAFSAQADAASKTYQYLLDRSASADPFVQRWAVHHPHSLDQPAVEEALRLLPGRKDWAGFAGAASTVRTTVRDLVEARYRETADRVGVFTFTADGFLNHMVRNLVGTLLEIGRGRFRPSRVARILETRDRNLAGPTAPARGLCLVRIRYGEPTEGVPDDGPWTAWGREAMLRVE